VLRVLYVEDSAADADLLQRRVARDGTDMALDVVSTLREGRERLNEPREASPDERPNQPPNPSPTATASFDALLVDLSLPDGSGLELVAHVRERDLPLAVVVLTGQGQEEAVVAAFNAGADDYVVKQGPYLQDITERLYGAVTRRRAACQNGNAAFRVLYVEHNPFDQRPTDAYASVSPRRRATSG